MLPRTLLFYFLPFFVVNQFKLTILLEYFCEVKKTMAFRSVNCPLFFNLVSFEVFTTPILLFIIFFRVLLPREITHDAIFFSLLLSLKHSSVKA